MVWQYAAVVAVGYGALKLLGSSEVDHDDVVEESYTKLAQAAPHDATIYADHIDTGPNPRGEIDGLSRIPDLVVKSGIANSLIVEVETAESLIEEAADARAQLVDFSTSGYRRVLVVPDDETAVEAARELVADIEGTVHLANPGTVEELL